MLPRCVSWVVGIVLQVGGHPSILPGIAHTVVVGLVGAGLSAVGGTAVVVVRTIVCVLFPFPVLHSCLLRGVRFVGACVGPVVRVQALRCLLPAALVEVVVASLPGALFLSVGLCLTILLRVVFVLVVPGCLGNLLCVFLRFRRCR